MVSTAVLMLADGRFPVGGHVHSAGVEAAVADGRVRDLSTLEAYLVGRLWTVGLTEAALAEATLGRLADRGPGEPGDAAAAVVALDAEADARLPVPALREASRRLGRQLVRVAVRCWPDARLRGVAADHPGGVHQPVALGAVAAAAGLAPGEVAALALHHALTTPAQAAVRLLGLDPFAVAALTVRLGAEAGAVAAEAVAAAGGPPADLPARSGPLVDVAAAEHRLWDVRLFAT
jgi:urease accessory protein